MPEYEFTVSLNRGVTKAEIDLLYEAGLGDTGIETGPRGTLLDVTRSAWTAEAAIDSVRDDVARVPGLRVTSVGLVVGSDLPDDLLGEAGD
jgi:hypothetical protein